MRWSNVLVGFVTVAVVLSISFMVALILPTVLHYVDHYTGYGYGKTQEQADERGYGPSVLGTVSDVVMVAFTFVLTVVAIWQGRMLFRSNKTAESALRETRRSVDSFIRRETGYISVDGLRIQAGWWCWLTLRNHGPSLVHIMGFNYRFQVVPSEDDITVTPHTPIAAVNHVIPSGTVFGSRSVANPSWLERELEIPEQERALPDAHFRALVLDFVYDGPFGVYERRITALMDSDDTFHISTREGLRYDRPAPKP